MAQQSFFALGTTHATKVILFQDFFKILKFSQVVNTFCSLNKGLTIPSVIYFKGPAPGIL